MSFDLLKIFHEMDWLGRSVTFVLVAMGVLSLAVFVERTLAFLKARAQSTHVARLSADLVRRSAWVELQRATAAAGTGPLGRLFSAMVSTFVDAAELSHAQRVELAKRERERQLEVLGEDLRRGLSLLASVGSVAPFVGLLGTVIGIITAFTRISETGSGGLGSVAGGISEALVVTALGLMVAIPAVLVFNRLSTRADQLHQGLALSSSQLVDRLEFHAAPVADNAQRGSLAATHEAA